MEDFAAALLSIETRLERIEHALALSPAARAPAITFKHGWRPKFWKDVEVRELAMSLWRQTTIPDALATIEARVGKSRTPSKSALHRFWKLLDAGAKR